MEESYKKWHDLQVKLAKSNINILNLRHTEAPSIDIIEVYYEFSYHPKPGKIAWFKTFTLVPVKDNGVISIGEKLLQDVLKLRKELEN